MASADVLATLSQVLSATLLPDNLSRKKAWEYLQSIERTPRFTLTLLQLTESTLLDSSVRQSAATMFKNIVRRMWAVRKPSALSYANINNIPPLFFVF